MFDPFFRYLSASSKLSFSWLLGASICGEMEAFMRALAMEMAPIRVNVVCPGVVKTDLWRNNVSD